LVGIAYPYTLSIFDAESYFKNIHSEICMVKAGNFINAADSPGKEAGKSLGSKEQPGERHCIVRGNRSSDRRIPADIYWRKRG